MWVECHWPLRGPDGYSHSVALPFRSRWLLDTDFRISRPGRMVSRSMASPSFETRILRRRRDYGDSGPPLHHSVRGKSEPVFTVCSPSGAVMASKYISTRSGPVRFLVMGGRSCRGWGWVSCGVLGGLLLFVGGALGAAGRRSAGPPAAAWRPVRGTAIRWS